MAHQNPGLTKNGPVNYRINARRLVLRASERRSKMIAVEVKDRRLTLSDVESTLLKSRQR